MFGLFESDILGFGNVHTSVAAALTLRMFHVKHSQGFQAKIWLTLRVYFFGSLIENINVFCLLRLVNYCKFLFENRRV